MTHDPAAARSGILARVAASTARRPATEHPGTFEGWRPERAEAPVEEFRAMFERAGGEVVLLPDRGRATAWIAEFAGAFETVAIGSTLPPDLVPSRPPAQPERAALAVSKGTGAVAETGSLLLDARDGRRTQLLAPCHVVVVDASAVHATLRDALSTVHGDLPSAIGLHSGPSKSADIGQVMVRGVHGPGRVVALIVTSLDSKTSP